MKTRAQEQDSIIGMSEGKFRVKFLADARPIAEKKGIRL